MLLYELLLEPIDRITLLQSPNQQPRPQKKVRFLCAFQNIPLTQTFHDHISKLSGLITFRKNVRSTQALSYALHISHQAKKEPLSLIVNRGQFKSAAEMKRMVEKRAFDHFSPFQMSVRRVTGGDLYSIGDPFQTRATEGAPRLLRDVLNQPSNQFHWKVHHTQCL